MASTPPDVLIVGAGPTGLTLAAALASEGVRALVLDRMSEGSNTSRAGVVHARTLEMLEPMGVAERLAKLGIHASCFTIRDRDRVLVPVRFDRLPTKYAYTLMLSQADTESVLRDRLSELGGRVLWQHELVDIVQRRDEVLATLDDGTQLTSRYLVAADGMHSTVRERLGIPFPGAAYEQSFSLADVRLAGAVPREEVILYFSPAGLLVLAPLPGGIHRIVATIDPAPEHPDAAFIQALLDSRGAEHARAVVREVVWGSRFHVYHRMASTYRVGRVVLAGDAAHVHSPAGGQGMNIGIQDAVVLAGALKTALATGDEQPLDAYASSRMPIARDVIRLADRLTRLATVSSRLRPLRNAGLHLLARFPAFRRRVARQLSGLAYRAA